jgi:hypothetical protein
MCVYPISVADGRPFPRSDWGLSVMLWLMSNAEHLKSIACKDGVPHDWLPECNGGDYDGLI